MSHVEAKINLLIDGMKRKAQALTEIKSITGNQGTVLESGMPHDEVLAFVVQMNREKQTHIQTVIQCDSLFEVVLKEIGAELDANQHMFTSEIGVLQGLIRQVMDLDVAIRVAENHNSELMQPAAKIRKPAETPPPPAKRPATPTMPPAPAPKKYPLIISDDKRIIGAYKKNADKFKLAEK